MIFRKSIITNVMILAGVFFSASYLAAEEGHECHGEHEHEAAALTVTGSSQKLIDLKVEAVKLAAFTKKISVNGQVARDPVASSYITAPASGVITACKVKMGSIVKKGDVLCSVKSGDAQSEIVAPIDGMIISDSFETGEKVDNVSSMHTIADLSRVWATFDIYEKDIAAVKVGQRLAVRSAAYPQEVFAGEVTFISPCVDEESHTIKARALIANPGYLLKLGMFVTADIMVELPGTYIVLPAEAVHAAGEKKVVFVKTGDEKFEAREVTIADQAADRVAVCAGVSEGDQVVVGNSFLLKSEYLKSQMSAGCAD